MFRVRGSRVHGLSEVVPVVDPDEEKRCDAMDSRYKVKGDSAKKAWMAFSLLHRLFDPVHWDEMQKGCGFGLDRGQAPCRPLNREG